MLRHMHTYIHLFKRKQWNSLLGNYQVGQTTSKPLSYTKISGDRAIDYNKRTNKKLGRFDVAVSCRYRFQTGVYITTNDVIF